MSTNMTEDELWEFLEGAYAYDTGSIDSGIHDPGRKERALQILDGMKKDAIRVFLSRRVRDAFLSEEAISQLYGIEDVASFWDWFENDLRQ